MHDTKLLQLDLFTDNDNNVIELDLLNTGLVFTASKNENEEPYTTDLVIAKATGFSKKYVDRKIRTHEKRLKKLGIRGIEFSLLKSGKRGKPVKIYRLHRKQAIALCNTFDDSPRILDFKFKLADAFIDVVDALNARKLEHLKLKPVNKSLADAIHDSDKFTHPQFDYSNVHKLIDKKVLGMPLNQFKKRNNVTSNASSAEYLSKQQMQDLSTLTDLTIAYINIGYTYKQLKNAIEAVELHPLLAV